MNKGKTEALAAAADLEMKQELANPTDQAGTDTRFPPGYIDDRVLPMHYSRGGYGRSGSNSG